MFNPTLRIASTLGLNRENESKYSGGAERGYTAFNDAGVECEVGEFLYGLVRVLKPWYILETGTHEGIGASYMGLGLSDNGFGLLDTLEYLDPHFETSTDRIKALDLGSYVRVLHTDARNFQIDSPIDLLLLDTEPQTRFAEFERYYPFVKEGGFIFIHDLHRHMGQVPNEEHGFAWPWGRLPVTITDKLRDREIVKFHFDTPRGLTGFYKVNPEDYANGN